MIKNREFYKSIFKVDNLEDFESEEMDDLLVCSETNWNVYFSSVDKLKSEEVDCEKIDNVELVEFDNEESMLDFWNSLDNSKKIDLSNEHELPCILKYL